MDWVEVVVTLLITMIGTAVGAMMAFYFNNVSNKKNNELSHQYDIWREFYFECDNLNKEVAKYMLLYADYFDAVRNGDKLNISNTVGEFDVLKMETNLIMKIDLLSNYYNGKNSNIKELQIHREEVSKLIREIMSISKSQLLVSKKWYENIENGIVNNENDIFAFANKIDLLKKKHGETEKKIDKMIEIINKELVKYI